MAKIMSLLAPNALWSRISNDSFAFKKWPLRRDHWYFEDWWWTIFEV